MSSLQKFHRRTFTGGVVSPFTTIGSGSDTVGYRLGYAIGSSDYLVVAPKSTEFRATWGPYGTARGTISTTDGWANTNTLYAFGASGAPAAYYAKSLTTGGYNTWYLPAIDELTTIYLNNSATPFANSNAFDGSYNWFYWSSSERSYSSGGYALGVRFDNGWQSSGKKDRGLKLRAVRKSTV
jgi:hypothetical protein